MLRNSGEVSGAIVSRAVDSPLTMPRGLVAWFARAAVTIRVWTERLRRRRALARLDDCLLRDIGLTRVQVWQEIRKPFWRR